MDRKKFQDWLAGVDNLSHAQRTEALAVLSGQPDSVLSLAAIEASVRGRSALPTLRHTRCGITWQGTGASPLPVQGLQAHVQCRDRHALIRASPQGALAVIRHVAGRGRETVRESARRCGLGVNTAFRWRHRFLEAAGQDRPKLKGIVEVDETYVLESHKGSRTLDRKARKRGGKASKRGLSDEQVPVLVAADRSGTTISEVLRRSTPRPCKRCSNRFWIPTSFWFLTVMAAIRPALRPWAFATKP